MRSERGQSTVEFVLVLPFVAILLLALIQAAALMRDHLLVSGAAREAAREAAVSSDAGRILRAAQRAAPGLELDVRIDRGLKRGEPVSVVVGAAPTTLPIVGGIVGDRRVEAEATMRVETVDGT